MTLANFRTFRWTLVFCCAGVAFADWLFYGHSTGGNLALFHFFLLLLAVVQVPVSYNRPAWIILLLLGGLVLALASQPGPLILCLFWLGLLAFLFTSRQGWSTNTVEWLARWLYFGITCFFMILRDSLLLIRWRNSGHGKPTFQPFARELIKWVLPAAGTVVFLGLFRLANPVLAYWLDQLENSFRQILQSWTLTPHRFFYWGVMLSLLWAFCRTRYRRKRHFSELGPGKMVSPSLLARCLTLFNAVFAIQTILDCVYLWGGAALPAGMTYAEYAHRGAYPLIATALLAGAFVLATFRAGMPTHETMLVRKLVFIWLGQNVVLTLNSLWRLHLYVEVYSLTSLRVAAAIWMLLISTGIILILWRIYAGKSNGWLLNANVVTLIAFLYICCFINFDGLISRYNVEHSREVTGKGVCLDVKYLESLGVEAIPALLWFQQNSSDPHKMGEAQLAAVRLMEGLNWQWGNWRTRTLRTYALKKEATQVDFSRAISGVQPQNQVHTKPIRVAGLPLL